MVMCRLLERASPGCERKAETIATREMIPSECYQHTWRRQGQLTKRRKLRTSVGGERIETKNGQGGVSGLEEQCFKSMRWPLLMHAERQSNWTGIASQFTAASSTAYQGQAHTFTFSASFMVRYNLAIKWDGSGRTGEQAVNAPCRRGEVIGMICSPAERPRGVFSSFLGMK